MQYRNPPKINSSDSSSSKKNSPPMRGRKYCTRESSETLTGPISPVTIRKDSNNNFKTFIGPPRQQVSSRRQGPPQQQKSPRQRALPRVTNQELIKSRVKEITDHLWMRRETAGIFITTLGKPMGEESTEFITKEQIKITLPLQAGSIIKLPKPGRTILGMVMPDPPNEEAYHTIIRNLYNKLTEENINKISLPRIEINISWEKLKQMITLRFLQTNISITICNGTVQMPSEQDRLVIIKENHESPVGGHKGVTKTYNRIRNLYHWPNMKKDVRQHIKTCISCQKKKLVRIKTKEPMIITDTPLDAFDKISMDIVGPLPPTKSGKSYILTIQDNLTKFSLAIPLVSFTSEEIAQAFITHFICQYGCPKAILTDQGTSFISSLMQKFAKALNIKQYKTSAFHPQSNGSLERSHHVLVEYLKHYITKEKQWDQWLPQAMFSYNTSIHEGTKYTPYELIYGKKARQPSSLIPNDSLATYPDFVDRLVTKLFNIRKMGRHNLTNSKHTQKYYYDRKVSSVNYHKGEQVLVLKPKRDKFSDEYDGPYTIIEILKNNNVKIAVSPRRTKVVHQDRIKRAYTPPDCGAPRDIRTNL